MRIFFILTLLISGVSVRAQKAAFIEKLKSKNQSLVSIEAKYTQTKKSPILTDDLTSSGIFFFMKDRNIRWEQQKPTTHILILNQDSIYEYRDDETASKGPIPVGYSQFQNLIANVVNGTFIHDTYPSAEVWIGDGLIHFRNTDPKGNLKKLIREIELTFDLESTTLLQLSFIDRSEQQIKIVFSEHQFNHLENRVFAIPNE